MLETAASSIGRAGLAERIRLAQADAARFDPEALFARPAFDRVFFSYSLSMIPDWRAAIDAALAAVAPGGRLHLVDFGRQEGLPAPFRALLYAWLRRFHVAPDAAHEQALRAAAAAMGAGYTAARSTAAMPGAPSSPCRARAHEESRRVPHPAAFRPWSPARSVVPSERSFRQQALDLGDGLARVEVLRAGAGAVHDRVAAEHPVGVVQLVEPLAGLLVAGVGDPAVGLQQDGRAEVAVAVPPVAGAARLAAEAEDAFPQPVEPLALLRALQPLARRRRRVGLEPRLDQPVLGVRAPTGPGPGP